MDMHPKAQLEVICCGKDRDPLYMYSKHMAARGGYMWTVFRCRLVGWLGVKRLCFLHALWVSLRNELRTTPNSSWTTPM